jgi:hypothetical protein
MPLLLNFKIKASELVATTVPTTKTFPLASVEIELAQSL